MIAFKDSVPGVRARVIFVIIAMSMATGCMTPPQGAMMPMGMDPMANGGMPMAAAPGTVPAAPAATTTPLTQPQLAQLAPGMTGAPGTVPAAPVTTAGLTGATGAVATAPLTGATGATGAVGTVPGQPAATNPQAQQIAMQIQTLDAQVGALLRQGVPVTDPRIAQIQAQVAPLSTQYQQLTGVRI